jgi:hypothetical protein
VLINSDTIDIPVCTSDVLLRQFSKTKDAKVKEVVTAGTRFDELLKLASPERRAVLEGLSKQLELKGDDRSAAARSLADSIDKQRRGAETRPGSGRRGGGRSEREQLRDQIRSAVLARWPEISNAYHPAAVEAISKESGEIVKLIEGHPAFARWDKLVARDDEREDRSFELERRWVKCQRFLYVAETVALEANLDKFAGKLVQAKYKSLRAAENGTLGKRAEG